MRGMWTRRPRVEEDSLRYLVVYIPWLSADDLTDGEDKEAEYPPATELNSRKAETSCPETVTDDGDDRAVSGSKMKPLPATPWQPDPSTMPRHTVVNKDVRKRLKFNERWFRQNPPWLHCDADVSGLWSRALGSDGSQTCG